MNVQDRFANPKLDLVFKKIFGDINNSDLLTSFLCAILKISPDSIKHIEIIDNEIDWDLFEKNKDDLVKIGRDFLNQYINKDL